MARQRCVPLKSGTVQKIQTALRCKPRTTVRRPRAARRALLHRRFRMRRARRFADRARRTASSLVVRTKVSRGVCPAHSSHARARTAPVSARGRTARFRSRPRRSARPVARAPRTRAHAAEHPDAITAHVSDDAIIMPKTARDEPSVAEVQFGDEPSAKKVKDAVSEGDAHPDRHPLKNLARGKSVLELCTYRGARARGRRFAIARSNTRRPSARDRSSRRVVDARLVAPRAILLDLTPSRPFPSPPAPRAPPRRRQATSSPRLFSPRRRARRRRSSTASRFRTRTRPSPPGTTSRTARPPRRTT